MKRYIRSAVRSMSDEDTLTKMEMAASQVRPEILRELANSEAFVVQSMVAHNPNTPVDVLQQLAEDDYEPTRTEVARNPKLSKEILAKLAEDPSSRVRGIVAINPSTPLRILSKLAGDHEWTVRKAVLENPKASSSIVERIAKNDLDLAYKAVSHPNCPHIIAEKLADMTWSRDRASLADIPACPPDILTQLAHDEVREVQVAESELRISRSRHYRSS